MFAETLKVQHTDKTITPQKIHETDDDDFSESREESNSQTFNDISPITCKNFRDSSKRKIE